MIKKSGTYDQKGVREVTNRKVSGHNSEAGIRGEIHNNYHKCFQRCKEKHATKNEQMGESHQRLGNHKNRTKFKYFKIKLLDG